MSPDRANMDEMCDLALQRSNELARTVNRETYEVNNNVSVKRRHGRAKLPGFFQRDTVHNLRRHLGPGRVWKIRLCLPTAEGNHLMASHHKARHQIGSDMAIGPNNNNARHV